jgi:DNA-directed RNA polymerase subunit H (RpoH/RPB5)
MAYPTNKAQAIQEIVHIVNARVTPGNEFVWKEIIKNIIRDFDITREDIPAIKNLLETAL